MVGPKSAINVGSCVIVESVDSDREEGENSNREKKSYEEFVCHLFKYDNAPSFGGRGRDRGFTPNGESRIFDCTRSTKMPQIHRLENQNRQERVK
jgi:hypothetical protein